LFTKFVILQWFCNNMESLPDNFFFFYRIEGFYYFIERNWLLPTNFLAFWSFNCYWILDNLLLSYKCLEYMHVKL
jgi:hypothetical protein